MFENKTKLEEIHDAILNKNPEGKEIPANLDSQSGRKERVRSFMELSGLNRTLSLIVTTKCPLRCAHCPIGIYGEPPDVPLPKLNESDVVNAIRAAKKFGYEAVNFVGGEPMLALDLVTKGYEECRAQGLSAIMVTAPVWASTLELARKKLSRLAGFDLLLLSYDKYHLEFLQVKHYENAIEAARELNINVTMNVCYTLPEEKAQLEEELAQFTGKAMGVQYIPYVPVGNCKDFPRNIPFSGVTIEKPEDLDRLERTCSIGTASIGLYKDVFACCWSMAVMDSPIRFDKKRSGKFEEDFKRMEEDGNVAALRKTGVLDSLKPDKKEKIFEATKGKKFVNECHLCLFLLDGANGNLWEKYVNIKS